jgi:hypothetical protein
MVAVARPSSRLTPLPRPLTVREALAYALSGKTGVPSRPLSRKAQ